MQGLTPINISPGGMAELSRREDKDWVNQKEAGMCTERFPT